MAAPPGSADDRCRFDTVSAARPPSADSHRARRRPCRGLAARLVLTATPSRSPAGTDWISGARSNCGANPVRLRLEDPTGVGRQVRGRARQPLDRAGGELGEESALGGLAASRVSKRASIVCPSRVEPPSPARREFLAAERQPRTPRSWTRSPVEQRVTPTFQLRPSSRRGGRGVAADSRVAALGNRRGVRPRPKKR